MVALMGSLVPGLLARKAWHADRPAIAAPSRILLWGLRSVMLTAGIGTSLVAAVLWLGGIDALPFATGLVVKIAYGMALLVTPSILHRLRAGPTSQSPSMARIIDLSIIGSGIVSSANGRAVGLCSIAERRPVEMVDHGAPRTPFLRFGDAVTARLDGGAAPWGRLDQRVVASSLPRTTGETVMSAGPATPTGTMPPRRDIDPFSDAFLADPYAHHAELRDAGPVVYLSAHGIYGMARYAEVSDALRDWSAFCSSRGVGLSDFAREAPWRQPSLLLETDPPIHDRTRRLMNRVVSLPALKALRPGWQARADMLVEGLVARRQVDIVPDLAEAFPLAIFPDTIGLPIAGRNLLLNYALATFNGFGPRNHLFEDTHAQAAAAVEWMAMACRRENLSPDGWDMEVYRAAVARQEAEVVFNALIPRVAEIRLAGPTQRRLNNTFHALAALPVELVPA
jgi:hypothetical protein